MFRAIHLELLGWFRISVDGTPETRPFTARQRQLLAYLALHADRPVPRQEIAGRLWPDSTDAQALTNLRREWHHLRDEWPAVRDLVDAGTRTLGLRPSVARTLDVRVFADAAERGLHDGDRAALEQAARLYRGDLLPDWAEAWIEPIRECLRRQAVQVLERLIRDDEQRQAPVAVIERARRLLHIDPLHEPAWCALMRAHAQHGERARALHLYQECVQKLRDELGVHPSAATRLVYREILEADTAASISTPESAPSAPAPRTLVYHLAGRQAEWATALRAWQAATGGTHARQQFLVIRGEAGIGKTRVAEELADWLRTRHVRVLTTRSYAADGPLAFAPVAAWLRDDAMRAPLRSLDPIWLTQITRLCPELLANGAEVSPSDSRFEPLHRASFFDALVRAFRAAAGPLLLVLDDLQWTDTDTLEWLHYLSRAAPDMPCLIVGTVRAEEASDNHALGVFLDEVTRLDRLTTIALGPLDAAATARLADDVAGRALDADAQARLFRLTEGHPLFIVEEGRMAQTEQPGDEARSPRVRAVVDARLARLSDEARHVAQIAAAIGRDFTSDLVAQVGDLDEDAMVRALDELWRRQIIRVHAHERWDFTHDRLRERAYDTLGPARRPLIHRRIAQAVQQGAGAHVDVVSATIAFHFDRGNRPLCAMPCFERAARAAMHVSANEEATRCLSRALSLVDQALTGRDRDERELALRGLLSAVLTTVRGYAAPEVEQNITRVMTLASTLGQRTISAHWLWGLWTVRYMLGDLRTARDVAERALEQSRSDPSCLWEAHHAMGGSLMSAGDHVSSRGHFETALDVYDPRASRLSAFGSDPGVFAHAWYAHVCWLLGDPDDATNHAEAGIALARRRAHPYSEALAHAYAALTWQLCGDVARVSAAATTVVTLSERYGFAYYRDWARVLLGWVRGREGRPDDGVDLIRQAIARLDAQRAQARRPYYLSLLAETHAAAGDAAAAAAVLDTAIAMALARDDRWWLPELYRRRSDFAPPARRASLLQDALTLAQAQQSASIAHRIRQSLAAS